MKPFVTPGGVGDTYWIVSVGLKCVRTQGIESLLNLTPLYLSCLRMYVVSVSDISAVIEFDCRMEVACRSNFLLYRFCLCPILI